MAGTRKQPETLEPDDVDVDTSNVPDQVGPVAEMTRDEMAERIVVPADRELHPDPGDAALADEQGAGTEPDRAPFATSKADEPILTGLAAGPGAHTPPDPAHFDADGRARP